MLVLAVRLAAAAIFAMITRCDKYVLPEFISHMGNYIAILADGAAYVQASCLPTTPTAAS